MERFEGSIWIAPYFGRPSISQTSCSSSGITSTIIVPITHWRDEHPIRARRSHDRLRTSTAIDGNVTVEACIRQRWLRDSPKRESLSLLSARPHAQDRSLFDVGSWADLIALLPPSAFTKRAAPYFRNAPDPNPLSYQFARDRRTKDIPALSLTTPGLSVGVFIRGPCRRLS